MRTSLRLAAAAAALLPAVATPARASTVALRVYSFDVCVEVVGDQFQGDFGGSVPCPGGLADPPAQASCHLDRADPVDVAPYTLSRGDNCTVDVTSGYYTFADGCETGNLGHQMLISGPGTEWAEFDWFAAVVAGHGEINGAIMGVDAAGNYLWGTAAGPLRLSWSGLPCAAHSVLRITAVVAMAEGV